MPRSLVPTMRTVPLIITDFMSTWVRHHVNQMAYLTVDQLAGILRQSHSSMVVQVTRNGLTLYYTFFEWMLKAFRGSGQCYGGTGCQYNRHNHRQYDFTGPDAQWLHRQPRHGSPRPTRWFYWRIWQCRCPCRLLRDCRRVLNWKVNKCTKLKSWFIILSFGNFDRLTVASRCFALESTACLTW